MERPLTDEAILTFLRVNKRHYVSQIELLQAAAQLLWPHGPPTDPGMRLAPLPPPEAPDPPPPPPRPPAAKRSIDPPACQAGDSGGQPDQQIVRPLGG